MLKVSENYIFSGVQKDLSASKQPILFLYDSRNIRLTAREDNTLMSITNEKGTLDTTYTINGLYLGHCLLNEWLVVFSTKAAEGITPKTDEITRFNLKEINEGGNDINPVKVLFSGNLDFNIDYPIDAISFFESTDILKIYWTDNFNQPRFINIVDATISQTDTTLFDFTQKLELREDITITKQTSSSGGFPAGVIQYAFTYYNKYGQESNIFYTSPLLYISPKDRGAAPDAKVENGFLIKATNLDLKFDFLRIYSILRTSVNATPMVKRVLDLEIDRKEVILQQMSFGSLGYYFHHTADTVPLVRINNVWHRADTLGLSVEYIYVGGSSRPCYVFRKPDYPDLVVELVGDNGKRYVTWGEDDPDNRAICVTKDVWSSQNQYRTLFEMSTDPTGMAGYYYSNEEPNKKWLYFTDIGTSGNTVDPTELLYKGGESILVKTLELKDNTLFFGNISLLRKSIIDTLKSSITSNTLLVTSTRTLYMPSSSFSGGYDYCNQLTAYSDANHTKSTPCGGFKRGDYYRCGVQFQDKTGKWSDPIFILDIRQDESPRVAPSAVHQSRIEIPTFTGYLAINDATELIKAGYCKVRPVVVYPELQDRVVLCLGVICPTMFTRDQREADSLYAQSSWFFRPYLAPKANGTVGSNWILENGTAIPTPFTSNDYNIQSNNNSTPPTFQDLYILEVLPYGHSDFKGVNSDPTYVSNGWIPSRIRLVEVQGDFMKIVDASQPTHVVNHDKKFSIDRNLVTLHSPDVEFDPQIQVLDFNNITRVIVGRASFTLTLSAIDLLTSSPLISSNASGFCKKGFKSDGAYGIVSGLFYEDYFATELNSSTIHAAYNMSYPGKWMVYPWQRTGSLNNDFERPANLGVRSAMLKKKVISNLRVTNTIWGYSQSDRELSLSSSPQVFLGDLVDIVKISITKDAPAKYRKTQLYEGNIDTLLNPVRSDGVYGAGSLYHSISTEDPDELDSEAWWKTFSWSLENAQVPGLYYFDSNGATLSGHTIPANTWIGTGVGGGNVYLPLVLQKEQVRMKYRSTPHILYEGPSPGTEVSEEVSGNTVVTAITNNHPECGKFETLNNGEAALPIVEFCQGSSDNNYYRNTMFGSSPENIWIPCGEPVRLDANTIYIDNVQYIPFEYSYGDTYFQRWDCLKTQAFTREDINQVVEIGSFMLETRVNIDGRYDRNRGLSDNTNISSLNFNLLNPVYSQLNNFFSYKILDDDYYRRKSFPNQITWSKAKTSGSDVDIWTNTTLASILEMDGSKGEITSINTLGEDIYCFQNKGVSRILFNSRVQIPVSDGVPIEISNSYKVDGYKYIGDGVGCNSSKLVKETPIGIYFIDSVGGHLFHIGDGITDISGQCNMSTLFRDIALSNNPITKLVYDDVNHDIYSVRKNEVICYSEKLNQFTGQYDYSNLDLIESYDRRIFSLQNKKLWKMFEGNYCTLFDVVVPWEFTFISNGISRNVGPIDKTFTNLEFRANEINENQNASSTLPLDTIESWNEYQHGELSLARLNNKLAAIHDKPNTESGLSRKFRIWRCDIPRNNKNSKPIDRMRNPWLFIKLKKKVEIYTDAEVEANNSTIQGAVNEGDNIPDTDQTYTKETANEVNKLLEGTLLYGQTKIRGTELHDLMVSYFI